MSYLAWKDLNTSQSSWLDHKKRKKEKKKNKSKLELYVLSTPKMFSNFILCIQLPDKK